VGTWAGGPIPTPRIPLYEDHGGVTELTTVTQQGTFY
jgi:hypothetical protein